MYIYIYIQIIPQDHRTPSFLGPPPPKEKKNTPNEIICRKPKKKKTRNINHLPKRKPDRVPKKNCLVRVPESSGSKPSSSSSKSTSCNKRSFSCWADSTSGQAAWGWGGWGWWFNRTVFWLGKPLMIEWLGCWVVSRSEILMELVYFK